MIEVLAAVALVLCIGVGLRMVFRSVVTQRRKIAAQRQAWHDLRRAVMKVQPNQTIIIHPSTIEALRNRTRHIVRHPSGQYRFDGVVELVPNSTIPENQVYLSVPPVTALPKNMMGVKLT